MIGYFFIYFLTLYRKIYRPSNILIVPPINAPVKQDIVQIKRVIGTFFKA